MGMIRRQEAVNFREAAWFRIDDSSSDATGLGHRMVLNRMRIRVTTLVLMMMMIFDEEDGRAGRRDRVLSRKRVGRE
jgi:hypothetical protein